MGAPKNRANNSNRRYNPKNNKSTELDWPEEWYATPKVIDEMSRYYEAEWAKENKRKG